MGPAIVRAEPSTAGARRAMVDNQIRTYDVTDQRVLEVFGLIPRELFLPPEFQGLAYSDAVLTVRVSDETRRTQLVPMVLARILQGLEIATDDRILVVAGGTGYAAALVAELAGSVVALEADDRLATATRTNAQALGIGTIEAVTGPLADGHAAGAPYDAILVCGGVERDLARLLRQLGPAGRLVAIQTESHEATPRSGKVTRYDRVGADVSSRVLFDATAPVLEAFRQPPSFVF